MKTDGRALRGIVLLLVMGGLVLPIFAGGVETFGAAFGYHPGLGLRAFSLDPWRQLFALPGFATSLRLTLVTGLGSTVLALLLALGFCAVLQGGRLAAHGNQMLTPILAVPHAALAIGLAFLIAPSGWIARMIATTLGWAMPPEIGSVNDAAGMALMLGLMVKELPFLMLVILAAQNQLPLRALLSSGQALGYGRAAIWLKLILPQLWPLIRLPVMVVQAFALSSVDMAIILGPSNPPTLAVAVTRWLSNPDLTLVLPASAGALAIAVVVLGSLGGWLLTERVLRVVGLWWVRRGSRSLWSEPLFRLASTLATASLIAGLLSLLTLILWSFAFRWSFPHLLPESWSLRSWANPANGWGRAAAISLGLALITSALSTLLAIAWLEAEDRGQRLRARWATGLIYLPLLLPQIAFLYGLNVIFLRLGISGGAIAVIWAQVLFVFPYVMIALSDPWRALDGRLIRTAASLGAGPNRRLWAVKLPSLLAPILTAAAIGFAVSIAQYLPTLFMGAGRIATLTTEAVTLSSGSDRRIIGTYAALQALLPFLAYATALAIPRLAFRNRQDMTGGRR